MDRRLSIIIPAYNEGKCIGKNIQTVLDQMYKWTVEVVVVNDGSTDNTSNEILKMVSGNRGKVVLLSYSPNMGKGYAVRYGLIHSKYRQKLIIDADLSVNPSEIEYFNLPENYAIYKGQRIQKVSQPLYRIFLGKGFKVLCWICTGMYLDTQSPFWFMNLPRSFYFDLEIDGFAFDVEILLKAKKKGTGFTKFLWHITIQKIQK